MKREEKLKPILPPLAHYDNQPFISFIKMTMIGLRIPRAHTNTQKKTDTHKDTHSGEGFTGLIKGLH